MFNKLESSNESEPEEWRLEGVEAQEDYTLPPDSDVALYKSGYIVVVPMRADEHDYDALSELQSRLDMLPEWSSK